MARTTKRTIKRSSKHNGLFGRRLKRGIKVIPKWLPTQRAIWCHIYAGLFSVVILAPLTIMFLDRRQPVELEAVSFIPNEVHEGDTATVTYKATILRQGCGGELLRTIVDSAHKVTAFIREATVFNNSSETGNVTFSKTLIIPGGVTPGPATYLPKIERWCNPLQRYLWPIAQNPEPTISFVILPPTTKGTTQ